MDEEERKSEFNLLDLMYWILIYSIDRWTIFVVLLVLSLLFWSLRA